MGHVPQRSEHVFRQVPLHGSSGGGVSPPAGGSSKLSCDLHLARELAVRPPSVPGPPPPQSFHLFLALQCCSQYRAPSPLLLTPQERRSSASHGCLRNIREMSFVTPGSDLWSKQTVTANQPISINLCKIFFSCDWHFCFVFRY